MLKAAVWVHGNSAIVEYTEYLADLAGTRRAGVHKGWGVTFHSEKNHWAGWPLGNWFHFSIPTPVILDDVRPQLAKVFVLYHTHTKTKVTGIHLYDGPNKVKSFDGLALSGDHSAWVDSANSWDINPPITIGFGLGISVGVDFIEDFGDPSFPWIFFATAGADFVSA